MAESSIEPSTPTKRQPLFSSEPQPDGLFAKWCLRTTCHGFPDVARSSNLLEKMFWTTVVFLSFAIIAPQMYFLFLDYALQEDYISTMYEVVKQEMPMPNLMICNYNRINYTKAKEMKLNSSHLTYINDQFYNPGYIFNNSMSNISIQQQALEFAEWRRDNGFNRSFTDLIMEISHSCEETIGRLVYQKRSVNNPCQHFDKVISMQLGGCLWLPLNMAFPAVRRPGHLDGIKMLLSLGLQDYETGYINRYLDIGIALFLHYDTFPNSWISLSPGSHHWINIRSERSLVKLGQSWDLLTMLFAGSSKEDPCTANGQFNSVRNFSSMKIKYNKFGCIFDCEMTAIRNRCGCVPMTSETLLPTCEPPELDACLIAWAAELNVQRHEVAHEASRSCRRACKYACDERFVSHRMSTSKFPAPSKLPALQQYSLYANGLNHSTKFIQENYIAVDVFYEALTEYTVEWRERMSVGQLISFTGGQLGICAGISLITIAQAIWFLCVGVKWILVCQWKKQKKIYSKKETIQKENHIHVTLGDDEVDTKINDST